MIDSKSKQGSLPDGNNDFIDPSLRNDVALLEDLTVSEVLVEISLKETLKFIHEINDILAKTPVLEKKDKDKFCVEQRRFMRQYMTDLLEKLDAREY